MHKIADQLAKVTARIDRAAHTAGRDPEAIHLLAVSKTQPAEAIGEAYRQGQRRFGESYLQEALDKQARLAHLDDIEWHFIGPVQSNKTRALAEHFAWVHSIDRVKIARRLSQQRPPDLPALNICLQVNLDNEASKAGVAPQKLAELATQVAELPGLRLRGLMAIPAPSAEPERQRRAFARLREALEQLQAAGANGLDTLSMGMSADLEAAVAEGATVVRVGSDIFGARPGQTPANRSEQ